MFVLLAVQSFQFHPFGIFNMTVVPLHVNVMH